MPKELAPQMYYIQEILRRLNIRQSDDNTEVTKQYGYLKFDEDEIDSTTHLAQYIRLALQTNPMTVVEFMQYGWCLPSPNLIISVVGGGTQFKISAHLRKAFQYGLAVAAATTNAWLITAGVNAGIVKEVGEALNKYRYKNSKHVLDVPCIGMCTWNNTAGSAELEGLTTESPRTKNSDDVTDEHYVHSYVLNQPETSRYDLEPNHTHFLLFDGDSSKSDTLLLQRANIEKYSRRIKIETSNEDAPIPSIMILVEGGPFSVRTVCQALQSNVPLVAIKGSGRAADLVADLYAFFLRMETPQCKTQQSSEREFVKDQTYHSLARFRETELNSIFEKSRANNNGWVDEIKDDLCEVLCHRKELVVIFEFDSQRHHGNLEDAILEALFNAIKFSGDHLHEQKCRIGELKLAMAWKKFDYAQKYILTDTTIPKWTETDLCQVLVDALCRNSVDFVELLMHYGASLEKLTLNNLEEVYASSNLDSGLPLGEKRKDDLPPRTTYYSCYFPDQPDVRTLIDSAVTLDKNIPLGRNAAREFFLWAIFHNRFELAKYLCSKTWNPSVAPLIAARIYRLASTIAIHSDKRQIYRNNAHQFDQYAKSIIDRCFDDDKSFAVSLLEQPAMAFDNVVPLDLAEQNECRAFLASKCVQKYLDQKWFDHIYPRGQAIHTKIFLCALFLPLLPFFSVLLPYVHNHQQMIAKEKNHSKNRRHGIIQTVIRSDHDVADDSIGWSKKIIYFYRAPIVRFYYNVIFFVVFLGLFSFVLLDDFLPFNVYYRRSSETNNLSLPIAEVVLHICLWSLIIEELRQFMMTKHYEYFSNAWNLIDAVAIVLYLVALITRFIMIETFFIISKIILCVDLILWFVGTLHLFAAFQRLGPKLTMIFNTMKDLFSFICFILIFLCAFSITSWSLINSASKVNWIYSNDGKLLNVTVVVGGNNSWTWGLLRNITHYGVWKVFGQVDPIDGTDSYSNMAFVLAIIFVLISNILLVNVLIALFNFTIQNVQVQSHDLWRYQRFLIVNEFRRKTPLPPPLNIIYYIFIAIRYLVTRMKCFQNQHRFTAREIPLKHVKTTNNSIKQQFKISDAMRREVAIAQEFWHDTFKKDKNNLIEVTLQNIGQKIDHLASLMQENSKITPINHQADGQTNECSE